RLSILACRTSAGPLERMASYRSSSNRPCNRMARRESKLPISLIIFPKLPGGSVSGSMEWKSNPASRILYSLSEMPKNIVRCPLWVSASAKVRNRLMWLDIGRQKTPMRATLSLSHIWNLPQLNALQDFRESGPQSFKIRARRNEYEITQSAAVFRESGYPIVLPFTVIRCGDITFNASTGNAVCRNIRLRAWAKSWIILGNVTDKRIERGCRSHASLRLVDIGQHSVDDITCPAVWRPGDPARGGQHRGGLISIRLPAARNLNGKAVTAKGLPIARSVQVHISGRPRRLIHPAADSLIRALFLPYAG